MAFLGFRHAHITALHNQARARDDVEIVACCEEDAAARASFDAHETIDITHDDYGAMLDDVPCDAVAVGDYYGKRGAVLIEALKRGKHVIADKPVCTSLAELDEIERLAAEKGLCVGCQLDLRDNGTFRAMRRLTLAGEIGEVHAVGFGGQHPLMADSRPGWYFEEGKHGGTLNDIAIHGIDLVPWLTGLSYARVNAARNWNARLPDVPHFRDCAQVMLTLENGCGVLGDVSYLAPDSFGYSLPQYWRVTLWGADGVLEASNAVTSPRLYRNGETAVREIPPDEKLPGGYLDAFVKETGGAKDGLVVTTPEVLCSSRVTLLAQDAADRGLTNVDA